MEKAKISEIVNNNVKILSKKFDYKKDFFGDAPAPFIGKFGYPNVNVGILSAVGRDDVDNLDDPKKWAKENKQISEVVDVRSSLVNSRYQSNIYAKQERLQMLAQEVGLAPKAVEVEINLKDTPRFKLLTDEYSAPRGPNAEMLKAKITQNVRIPTKIERVHADTDLKANTALSILYKKSVDENHLSQMLSVGAFGIGKNRKLVPTRWSITATDDTLGKSLLSEVRYQKEISHYELYFGGYIGNYYLILLLPEVWHYELFEMSTENKGKYSTDYEMFSGRSDYAENCAGGYYSVRLAILEHMQKMKRQGLALVFRFITPEYNTPLGVWVTREATRKALASTPYILNSKEALFKEAKELILEKFDFDLDVLLNRSKLLEFALSQKKLFDF